MLTLIEWHIYKWNDYIPGPLNEENVSRLLGNLVLRLSTHTNKLAFSAASEGVSHIIFAQKGGFSVHEGGHVHTLAENEFVLVPKGQFTYDYNANTEIIRAYLTRDVPIRFQEAEKRTFPFTEEKRPWEEKPH